MRPQPLRKTSSIHLFTLVMSLGTGHTQSSYFPRSTIQRSTTSQPTQNPPNEAYDLYATRTMSASDISQGVVRRTSIHIESSPATAKDALKDPTWLAQGGGYHECNAFAEYAGNDKHTLRKVLTKWSSQKAEDRDRPGLRSDSSVRPHTTPRQGIRGLEHAASLKEWAGGAKPPEAWGKLRRVC